MMTPEEQYFNIIGSQIKNATKGQLFGKPCYKIEKKAFTCFFKDCMVFKLQGNYHQEAMSYDGAVLFDPSGKNRPMKEWVQLPYDYKDRWALFAEMAANYVAP